MELILCIETATEVCSVALFRDGQALACRESVEKNAHSARLTSFIGELFSESGCTLQELSAVAVSMGPGSYTGLRIGVATAKGLCYALDKPLIAVPTLQSMASGIFASLPEVAPPPHHQKERAILCCPMIDARRMEVYAALYDATGKEVREVRAEIIDEVAFGDYLAGQIVCFGGDGATKCRNVLGNHPNAWFIDGFRTSARFMAGLAGERFREGAFENLAYFEPFYLKDFVAGKPKVKGLV